ncbi:MAG: hypothetical protein AAGA70_09845 [Pseudomonadota bacterium]
MPTVADYAVLRDGAFTLGPGEEERVGPFFRPDDFVAGTSLAKAVLAYKVRPLQFTDEIAPVADFTITKSGVPETEIVRTESLVGNMTVGLWEAFPATGFGQNIGSSFFFRVSSGRARFADVILWYQVRVPAL